MIHNNKINHLVVIEDSQPQFMARILNSSGEAAEQSHFGAGGGIAYKIYDEAAVGDGVVKEGTLTVADVVFDTLQTDDRWTKDDQGYNFRWQAPADAFPNGNKQYRVEIAFTETGGSPIFYVLWRVRTIERHAG